MRELIPDFYTCPEMFMNYQKLDLGKTQNGIVVWDVLLPPWAADSYQFVSLMRRAL